MKRPTVLYPVKMSKEAECPRCKSKVEFMQTHTGKIYCPKCDYYFFHKQCHNCGKSWNSRRVAMLSHAFMGKTVMTCPYCRSTKVENKMYRGIE